MIALLVVVGSTFALIQREQGRDETRIAANAGNGDAAGDVDVLTTEPLPPDPGGLTTDGNLPQQGYDPSALPPSLPSKRDEPLPGSLPPATAPSLPPTIEPSVPRQSDPAPTVTPAPVTPTPPPASPQPPASGTTTPSPAVSTATGCASPAMADQRACLSDLISSGDRELTSVYQALLRSVEERRGAAAVENVRADQRAWLGRRDQACRTPAAVDGTLWARERGACMARQSNARALELARQLAEVRSG
ncbi:MAG: DUF1311 domain-containing protein [Gemmatimonadaceae bacterium]|nr:DUF1311 domain-containing protein [Gemmatimonadaceae bacterium]